MGKWIWFSAGSGVPVRVFINQGDAFEEKTAEFGLDNTRGWWKTLFSADINGNGWPDLIAGNQGTNSKLKSPAHLFISDWDKNGKEDPILAYERSGKLFPLANRDELIRQVPSLKKKFVTHQSFAGKSMDQIFGKKSLEHAGHQYTDTFESSIFLNLEGKSLQRKPLPKEVQFSPVLTIQSHEVGKGKVNFIVGGNFLHASPYFGPYDAGRLWYLEGNGNGDFDVLYPFRTGLKGSEEVRDLQWIAVDGENYLVAAQNDGEVIYFKWKKNK
jgi:enediyne biosynthesis protein E4